MFKKISNEQILKIAKKSKSITETCQTSLGYSDIKTIEKVKKILNDNGFDFNNFNGKKTSVLNNREKLEKAVKESFSYKEVLEKFGLSHHNQTLKKHLLEFKISTEHFCSNRYTNFRNKKDENINLDEVFCLNSNKDNSYLKKLILEKQLIPYICSTKECGNTGMWCGKPITLQLEHKNGIREDNRLENLEFLCPNCHTQTATYGSKNLKNRRESVKIKRNSMNQIYKFFILENNINNLLENISKYNSYRDMLRNFNFVLNYKNTKYLKEVLDIYKDNENVRIFNKNRLIKNRDGFDFPEPHVLLKMIEESNYLQVAKKLGCSDNGIRKYLRKNGLIK